MQEMFRQLGFSFLIPYFLFHIDIGTEQELPKEVYEWKDQLGKLPRHGAIMHLFIAIDAFDTVKMLGK